MVRFRKPFVLLCVAATCGCGGNFAELRAPKDSAVRAGIEASGNEEADEQSGENTPADLQRKIVYEAEVSLVVNDFAQTEIDLPKLVKQVGGYLADVSVRQRQGSRRTGCWKMRIPVAQFESFLEAVSQLGVPENVRQTAEDVTAEFIDLEARIANKKRLEERMVKLLDSASDKIADLIEVERELARVRSEIEQMEGRLRYMSNRIDLTTVTVNVREERDYVPPQAPTFLGQISRAWSASLRALLDFGKNATVAIVAAFPWLVVGAIALFIPVGYARKRIRRRKQTNGDA